ncbi:hypothetical protein [Streptomyces sp. NPDC091215]|uniref:hypothetical protein n=1 Tax=Streptomyces sp. NPDC091215 TaxID=3155192 RepID=UPI0034462593
MGFGVLGETFVVVCVAAGVHASAVLGLGFPMAGQDVESLGDFGPGDGALGGPEAFAGPVHQVAGVTWVGPGLGDLRLGEAQVPEDVAGGVAVLDVGDLSP